jgi:hypothetical protein
VETLYWTKADVSNVGALTSGGAVRARMLATIFIAALLVGAMIPSAIADTRYTSWTFVHKSESSCGFYRNHIDNTNYQAGSTTKNVERNLDNSCSNAQGNNESSIEPYALVTDVTLRDDANGYVCGSTGNVYNVSNSGEIQVTQNYISFDGCHKHAGDLFHSFGDGAKWDPDAGAYFSSGSIASGALPFN